MKTRACPCSLTCFIRGYFLYTNRFGARMGTIECDQRKSLWLAVTNVYIPI